MSYCTELGYKEGDIFRANEGVVGNVLVNVGDTLVLSRDDKTDNPFFTILKGEEQGNWQCAVHLDSIDLIYPEQEVGTLIKIEEKVMTPCEEKGYEVGQVFKTTSEDHLGWFNTGAILVLVRDDKSNIPKFACINGMEKNEGRIGYAELNKVVRLYPSEVTTVETIDLMGHTYNKEELEEALKNVKEL